MRRDEQRSPVLVFPVFLATMPSPRHAIAGDGERVVGRGTFRDAMIITVGIYKPVCLFILLLLFFYYMPKRTYMYTKSLSVCYSFLIPTISCVASR